MSSSAKSVYAYRNWSLTREDCWGDPCWGIYDPTGRKVVTLDASMWKKADAESVVRSRAQGFGGAQGMDGVYEVGDLHYGNRRHVAKLRKADPRQFDVGVAIEMEHTNDKSEAELIAVDHLLEDPHYYYKLCRHVESGGPVCEGLIGRSSSWATDGLDGFANMFGNGVPYWGEPNMGGLCGCDEVDLEGLSNEELRRLRQKVAELQRMLDLAVRR